MMLKAAASFFIIRQIAQADIVRAPQFKVSLNIRGIHICFDIGNYLIDLESG